MLQKTAPTRLPATGHFADDLVLRQRRLGHPLCVGLDPHLERIPASFRQGTMAPADPRTAEAVERFLTAVLDRIADRVALVKPQIAFFERLGWRGLRALAAVVEHARRLGLLVLLDAKRGDIGSTAAAYAAAYLGADAVLACDAMTVNPYLGRDSLAPFLDRARRRRRGLFPLVRTSNPGSRDFQDLRLEEGNAVYEAVASALAPDAAELRGPETGWSLLGAVVGATWPAISERVREILPHSLFLVPGYGAQGGSARDAFSGFVRGPGGRLEGGAVNSSRAILYPDARAETAASWERSFEEALRRAIDDLGNASA